MTHTPDKADSQLHDFVNQHPGLFVLTGAGCSTASGLGDYRDKRGEWKRAKPITGQTFTGNERARKRYWARSSVGWPAFSQATPGPAHTALQAMQGNGYIQYLVTQNVDQLHQKAGHERVVDLHGVLADVRCVICKHTISRDEFQIKLIENNAWLSSLSAEHAPDGDADLDIDNLDNLHIPPCQQCSGLLKPDVVFFGESVPRPKVQAAMNALALADAVLVVGSSLMVYSGFRFCREAQRLGKPLAIVNDGVTRADELCTLKVPGDCGSRLSTLCQSLQPV